MIKATRIESFSVRSIGVTLSCLCAFLFQTSNAAMSHHFTSVETVINNNISQAKKSINKNYTSPTNFHSKVSNSLKYNGVHFTICNNCYWCASCITDETKLYYCPSCRGTRVRSIPISTSG
jgi:flavoprotein